MQSRNIQLKRSVKKNHTHPHTCAREK